VDGELRLTGRGGRRTGGGQPRGGGGRQARLGGGWQHLLERADNQMCLQEEEHHTAGATEVDGVS
jgi:hypothetical protein